MTYFQATAYKLRVRVAICGGQLLEQDRGIERVMCSGAILLTVYEYNYIC